VPRHLSFLFKIKRTIVLLVCKCISSNHPFIYPTIHLFVSPSIWLSIFPSIHLPIYTSIHIYTYHCSVALFLFPLNSLSLSLSLSHTHTHTHWHARTFCLRSKSASLRVHPLSFLSQFSLTHTLARPHFLLARAKHSSVSQSACVIIILILW